MGGLGFDADWAGFDFYVWTKKSRAPNPGRPALSGCGVKLLALDAVERAQRLAAER